MAPREAYQAQRLLDDGMAVPLLLDPENRIRELLGIDERFHWKGLLSAKGAMAYVRAARQARNFDPIWRSATERPAMLAVNRHGDVVWSHIGRRIGDYPSVEECLDALKRAAR